MISKDKKSSIRIDADRPIENSNRDQFGFDKIAESLAASVLDSAVSEGIVIGIEGAWGSGKSSLLNLLCSHLKEKNDVRIIHFSPWIIGNRNELIRSLIAGIADEVKDEEGGR